MITTKINVFVYFIISVFTIHSVLGSGPSQKDGEEGFEIRLDVKHGHIGDVYIGCHPKATDGFDRELDDMAPPPGMGGVGYVSLISPDKKYSLYRDIRPIAQKVLWVFYVKPSTNPVEVSWDTKLIPDGWEMFCGSSKTYDGANKKVQNCRETTSVKAGVTTFIHFWVEKKK